MCVCECVCVCIYVYGCVYVYVCVCVCVCVYVCSFVCYTHKPKCCHMVRMLQSTCFIGWSYTSSCHLVFVHVDVCMSPPLLAQMFLS